jgi:uncharacterized protein (TIGR02001 family)
MKSAALILTALLAVVPLAAQGLLAPVPAEPPAGAWLLTPALVSQYMFRGVRLGGPSFQPVLEYNRGALAVGVWGNFPLEDKVEGQSDPEFDFYGSYTFEIAPALSVVPGLTVYTYPGASAADGFYQATFEPSLSLNYTLGAVRLTPKVYYDFVLKGPTAELTAAFAIPLPALGTELDFTASLGTFKWTDAAADTTPPVKNWGNYWLFGVTAPYQFSPSSRITVGWAYTAGFDNYLKQGDAGQIANPAAQGHGVFTLSYTCTF